MSEKPSQTASANCSTLWAEGLSCPEEKRAERAIELGGLMLGALVMARATNDEELSETIRAKAQRRALQIIEEKV